MPIAIVHFGGMRGNFQGHDLLGPVAQGLLWCRVLVVQSEMWERGGSTSRGGSGGSGGSSSTRTSQMHPKLERTPLWLQPPFTTPRCYCSYENSGFAQ